MNLSTLIASIRTVRSADADQRRRGLNLITISLGLAALAIVFIPITLNQGNSGATALMLVAASFIFLGVAYMAHIGLVGAGSWLLIGVTIVATIGSVATNIRTNSTPFFLVIPIMLASVVLRPAQIWSVLVLCLLGLASAQGLLPADYRNSGPWQSSVVNSSLLLLIVTLTSFIAARGTRVAFDEAQAARDEARAAGEALAANNAVLERRVEERTEALRQIADEQRAAAAQLKASLETQHELNRIVAELAVPVIPVSAGTLVVPLVGNIDSARASQVLASVLKHVETSGARTVVLDVTGVALVDTHVAGALLRVAQATRLMGAETVLAGIRPEVAQALVGLGVDLQDLHTVATLQEAL